MSKPDVSQEAVDNAIWSIVVLLEEMRTRIKDLKMIWRRQRMDVDTQVRYYANGLLEGYYRVRWFPSIRYGADISCQKYHKEEFDTDLEDSGDESEWDSEDEWTSEDGAEDTYVADNANNSSAGELSE